jgi:hypothetical protein
MREIASAGGMRLALALASLATIASASPVAAECMEPAPPKAVSAYVGYAFVAFVTSVSDQPTTQLPGNSPFNWEVVLDVSRVYRGSVPHQVVVDGWSAGCGWFRGRALSPGDGIFMTANQLKLPTLDGDLLVWRRAGDTWHFDYETVIPSSGGNVGVFPHAAVAATTTSELVDLFGPDALPPTDAFGPTPGGDAGPLWLVVLGALGAGLAIERRRRSIAVLI